jgi:DNA helicase-2/ATP-dependent DNA helicase PcrA
MLDKPFHTDEQLDILTAASTSKANIMIEALAGTGKTSTLEALVSHLPRQPILYLCFNKKNANEATARMPSTTTVRTFNSIGHRVWAGTTGKSLRLEPKKTFNILREIIEESPKSTRSALWDCYYEVAIAVGMAKSLGYLPEGCYPGVKSLVGQGTMHSLLEEEPDDLASDLIDSVLIRGIKQSFEGLIDYNDQVYMPALFKGTFPQFPIILVDEYQDLSPANHALLGRLVRGRVIGVGDPNQNIYGFRGAKAGGMSEAISHYSMTTFPLSTSFRCPSAIVNHVKWHVPSFKASKEGGNVSLSSRISHSDIGDGATIICRNNAPILRIALALLSNGRSVTISGSDIGPKLINIMRKLGSEDMTKAQTLSAITEWEQEKLARESKTAEDLASCMRVFADHGSSLGTAIAYAEHLFKQTGTILLTTIHKAKGLEWRDVYHLDPWMVRRHPSGQNRNLDYVCSTRSCDSLTEIASEDIQW